MSRRKKTFFEDSATLNNATYMMYLDHFTELSISTFKYDGLPKNVDARFLELTLFEKGEALWSRDEVMGDIVTRFAAAGPLDLYNVPIRRHAYASNGYQRHLDADNSVIIYNNLLWTNSLTMAKLYARRLYNLDRAIDVNANAQKTPVLLMCDQEQRLTLLNLFKEVDGNAPVIHANKGLDLSAVKVFKTDAPYVADKLFDLKSKTWNEALTKLGISNITYQKKERMVTDEVLRSQGGTIASRFSRLEARREALEKINEMFGLNVSVEFRETDKKENKDDEDFYEEEGGDDE